jgi:hypothetical protein
MGNRYQRKAKIECAGYNSDNFLSIHYSGNQSIHLFFTDNVEQLSAVLLVVSLSQSQTPLFM